MGGKPKNSCKVTFVDKRLRVNDGKVLLEIKSFIQKKRIVTYSQLGMGALKIPVGTFHRSVSNHEGSIVLNQAIRDERFNPENEFKPVSLRNRKDLQEAQGKDPVYWAWEKDQIKRIKFDPIQSKEKVLKKL